MAGVNKVILVGNLGSDPEVRHLESGSTVANFNVATSESYNNRNGERVTQTEWHKIELWDGLAKTAEQYLRKGNTVYVEGKLRTEQWQDKDGNNRSTVKVRVSNMVMLGGRANTSQSNDGGASTPMSSAPAQNSTPAPQANTSPQAEEETDDLPF